MNTKIQNIFSDDVGRGSVEYKTPLTKFGRGITDDTPTSTTTISKTSKPIYVYPDYAEAGVAVNVLLIADDAADTGQVIKIYGLDKHGKDQSELLTTAGLTGVQSAYKYIRNFRMKIVSGAINVDDINLKSLDEAEIHAQIDYDNKGRGQGQTEMAIWTVPKGHEFLMNGVDASTYETDKTNLILCKRDLMISGAPWLTKYNWMMYRSILEKTFPIADLTTEMTDIEIRSYNVSGVGEISAMFYGTINQLNSVPVDLENFSAASSGVDGITLSWDEQTPAETVDMKGFIVTCGDESILLSDKDASGYTFRGLETGKEYTVSAYWVGYDDNKSTIETGTVTLGDLSYSIAGLQIAGGGTLSSSDYTYTDDSGDTWSNKTGVTGKLMGETVAINNMTISVLYDPDSVTDKFVATSDDGLNFVYDDGHSAALDVYVLSVGDRVIKVIDSTVTITTDGLTWSPVTGLSTLDLGKGAKIGSTYFVYSNGDIYSSADGLAFTVLATQPSITPVKIGHVGSVLIAASDGDSTAPLYEYSSNLGVSWTASTSAITATEASMTGNIVEFDGYAYNTILEDAQDGSYMERTADGITWESIVVPGSGNLAIGYGTDGTNLYQSLLNLTTDVSSISAFDGTSWATPVTVYTGTGSDYIFAKDINGFS